MIELREGDLNVRAGVRREGSVISLDLELRRSGKLGLKIHEKLLKLEEVNEILRRPNWLGRDSDELVRRTLKLILEGKHEET
ncbi:MAG: hypothetical protein NZ992_03095 [Candidatus Korarchaeum sp.]|nr:hypothetical protein [Candidatus Korarchaeum sp.]MDW8035374.1 hypothetical protein [Candidatus Korarchaeum sp.]